jgi:hypothetical protein
MFVVVVVIIIIIIELLMKTNSLSALHMQEKFSFLKVSRPALAAHPALDVLPSWVKRMEA